MRTASTSLRGGMFTLVLFTCWTPSARAFFLPPFDLDASSWKATDIAIVSEGDAIDGEVTVLEVWRGKLAVGDSLKIPGLERFAAPESRRVFKSHGVPTKNILDAKRIVVFLVKSESGWAPASGSSGPFDDIGIASAWVDGGKIHVRSQLMPSGAQLFHESGSEASMRRRVFLVSTIHRDLAAALETPDPTARARRLAPIVRSGMRPAAERAAVAIAEAGTPHASRTFRELLGDERLPSVAGFYVLRELRRLEGSRANLDVRLLIARELSFWRSWELIGPPPDFGSEGRRTLEDRATFAQYVLEALRGTEKSCAPLVQAFRDFAGSSKALRGHRSVLAQTCERVLTSLRKPPN